jgi:hypothetical protein
MKVFKILLIATLITIVSIWIYCLRTNEIEIGPLVEFAMNCEPCVLELKNQSLGIDSGLICTKPPIPPDDVIEILDKRSIDKEYEKWVLLIYLKLYEKQKFLTHQSFETRDTPYVLNRFNKSEALSRAFCQIVGKNEIERKLGPEFLPASKAYEFIKENELFLNDKEIQNEMSKIDSLEN